MNLVTRRRLAIGAVAASAALVGGLVVAPSVLAAAGALTVTPSGAQNKEAALVVTFTGRDTDFQYGATATFVRVDGGSTFTAATPADQPPTGKKSSGKATINLADGGDFVGTDGPADSGAYTVTTEGKPAPTPIQASVTGPGGGSDSCAPGCFTVLPTGQLVVASVTPSSLRPGTNGNVTIVGDSFERHSAVEVLFSDGTVDTAVNAATGTTSDNSDDQTKLDKDVTTRTQLKRRFKVANTATPGVRDVRVRNLDGSSSTCPACFFVAGPSLTSSNPTADFNDPTQPLTAITFTGSNVTNGTPSLEYVGPTSGTSKNALAVIGTNVRDYTGTSITADFDLRNAAPGSSAYQPFVRGSDGIVNACDNCRFTVVQRDSRLPTITSMDSDTATAGIQKDIKAGETQTFVVTGTNFSKGASLLITSGGNAAAGLTVTNVDFVSPEQLSATISAASNAATGPKDVQVVLTDGKKSNTCTGCINVVAGASPSPSSSASRSATATATTSPRPSGCPSSGVTVRVNTRTINATGLASVTVTGAAASATVELQGYSQNHQGDVTFDNDPTPIDRTGRADNNGTVTFNDLRPSSNTRLRARQLNCTYNNQSDVIEVRAQETLEVVRTGSRAYTFRGRSIPAREGGLIVSLYRIIGSACPAGVEPSRCPGEKFIGQARAVSLGSPGQGLYSIRIVFPAADQNKRDEFVVKTGRDAQNAPGRSNARSLLIN